MVVSLLGQTGGAEQLANPSTWEQFGPFGVVFLVMSILGSAMVAGLIVALRRAVSDGADREAAAVAAGEARVKAIIAERDAERNRLDQAQRDLLTLHERVIPILEHVGTTVEANTAAIRYMQEANR